MLTSLSVLWRSLIVLSVACSSACSADAAPEPEPTLTTKGAFIALKPGGGDIELYRVLAVVGDGGDHDPFFVVPYSVVAASFDDARELAKDPELPHRSVKAIARSYITSKEWKVVWFRSVSAEEEASFR